MAEFTIRYKNSDRYEYLKEVLKYVPNLRLKCDKDGSLAIADESLMDFLAAFPQIMADIGVFKLNIFSIFPEFSFISEVYSDYPSHLITLIMSHIKYVFMCLIMYREGGKFCYEVRGDIATVAIDLHYVMMAILEANVSEEITYEYLSKFVEETFYVSNKEQGGKQKIIIPPMASMHRVIPTFSEEYVVKVTYGCSYHYHSDLEFVSYDFLNIIPLEDTFYKYSAFYIENFENDFTSSVIDARHSVRFRHSNLGIGTWMAHIKDSIDGMLDTVVMMFHEDNWTITLDDDDDIPTFISDLSMIISSLNVSKVFRGLTQPDGSPITHDYLCETIEKITFRKGQTEFKITIPRHGSKTKVALRD